MTPDGNSVEAPVLPKTVTAETVVDVRHWTDELFSFRLTRPASFRFRSGEFVMLGLMGEGKPLLRAYSIASPSWDDGLDFFSIKVPDGPLTSRLQHIKEGDTILLGKKPTGTLVLDALKPGKRLYMLSTGTGIAPFASLIREPDAYEKFDQIILTHTCRHVVDLGYGRQLVDSVEQDPLVGELVGGKLTYYATTTREDFPTKGRITDLIENGRIFADLGIAPLNPEEDRVMICGSMAMLQDTKSIVEDLGFEEGSNAKPGDFVVEKAFVD
ncbi:ferredoxin--NADP reductase [Pelagibius marinus]|uniref:ferredoxin--NADP reductase n=1 Tax=Pelagibius marinus TaxID=2762760 RepID=UPI00187269EC|nr:ferredoxin--NADP reductase [Pelagibius marinus]